jgi:hypothetical protein
VLARLAFDPAKHREAGEVGVFWRGADADAPTLEAIVPFSLFSQKATAPRFSASAKALTAQSRNGAATPSSFNA